MVRELSQLTHAIRLGLAWLLAQGEHIVPIPGTRNAKRIAENAGGADFTLSSEDLTRIDEILPNGGFGARYGEASLPDWE